MSPSSRSSLRAFACLVSAALAALGCVQVEHGFGRPVADDALLAQLQPGVSTRADVLALLGPPEEFVLPLPMSRLRAVDPAALRIVEERDLLGRRAYTWTHEQRRDDVLAIIPYFMIFWATWTEHRVDRVLVTFDEGGFVEDVGVRREIGR